MKRKNMIVAAIAALLVGGIASAQVQPGEQGALRIPEPMGPGQKGVDPERPPEPPPVPAERATSPDMQLRADALKLVRNAAVDDDPATRAQAIEALQRGVGAEAADTFMQGLRDPEPIVRFAAAMATGTLELRQAYPDPLLRLAHPKEDAQVRVGAIYALYKLHDTRLTQQLAELASHNSEEVRGSAVLALGLIGEPSAIDVLRKKKADPSPAVRLQAYEALWRLGDVSARNALVSGMFSRYPDEELFCTLALAARGDKKLLDHIRPKLTSEYSYIALAAARAMGQLDSDAGYGVAVEGAHSKDPRDRALAAFAFGDIGRRDAQPFLKQLLKDPDFDVRLAAADAILELTAPPEVAELDRN